MTASRAPKPQPYTYWPADRAAIAAGYRHIADLIESGDAPIPLNLKVSFMVGRQDEEDQAGAAAELRRALGGGHYTKNESIDASYLFLEGMCGGLPVQIWMDRNAVCKRVVVGTDTVTEEIRVGEDTRPVETVTREVERVEWVCSPLLGEDTPAVTA